MKDQFGKLKSNLERASAASQLPVAGCPKSTRERLRPKTQLFFFFGASTQCS